MIEILALVQATNVTVVKSGLSSLFLCVDKKRWVEKYGRITSACVQQ